VDLDRAHRFEATLRPTRDESVNVTRTRPAAQPLGRRTRRVTRFRQAVRPSPMCRPGCLSDHEELSVAMVSACQQRR